MTRLPSLKDGGRPGARREAISAPGWAGRVDVFDRHRHHEGPTGNSRTSSSHFRDITEQRVAEEQLRASEENLRTVAAVARELPSHEDPRQAICAAAAVIAGADIVQLWEPDGGDHLQITAATGIELPPDARLPLTARSPPRRSPFTAASRASSSICMRLARQYRSLCGPDRGGLGALRTGDRP